MPTVEEFRSSLQGADAGAIVDEWLLAPGAKYVGQADIDYIQIQLAARYGMPITEVQVWITGSAKLGFSISEKRKPNVPSLPRYRTFGPSSDIDVAVVSRPIFELVWRDLSLHSHRQPRFPWVSGRLGDYLVCGWLRPDHFPRNVRLDRCDNWWDVFRQLSAEPRFRRRPVRGGLFHSTDQLRSYLSRAVAECIAAEDTQ
jgi:hypothetical protein